MECSSPEIYALAFKAQLYACTITVDELGDGVNLGIDSWKDLGIDYGGNVD